MIYYDIVRGAMIYYDILWYIMIDDDHAILHILYIMI